MGGGGGGRGRRRGVEREVGERVEGGEIFD